MNLIMYAIFQLYAIKLNFLNTNVDQKDLDIHHSHNNSLLITSIIPSDTFSSVNFISMSFIYFTINWLLN